MPDSGDHSRGLSPVVARIEQRLRSRREQMVGDLAALVAVESPSTDEVALRASAQAVAGLGTRLLDSAPGRIGAHLWWSHGATGVLLIGHHDTVWPVGTLARWPFTVDGDTASGPGCFDMKAGLVQMLHALSVLPSLDGITVVVNADEEIGSPTSRDLIRRAARGARTALVCEPSADGALKIARKGIARYRLDVAGRAAHSGLDPGRGINAGVELAHQVLAVAALGRGETTVTPTVLSAGTTPNTVPASATMSVDVRAFHGEEFARVEQSVRSLRPVLPGAELVVSGGIHRPAFPPSASASLHSLARDTAGLLGLPEPQGAAVGGASDGNLTADLGVPTLDGLGPVGGNAHAEGEFVDLPAMTERASLLAALIHRLQGPTPAFR